MPYFAIVSFWIRFTVTFQLLGLIQQYIVEWETRCSIRTSKVVAYFKVPSLFRHTNIPFSYPGSFVGLLKATDIQQEPVNSVFLPFSLFVPEEMKDNGEKHLFGIRTGCHLTEQQGRYHYTKLLVLTTETCIEIRKGVERTGAGWLGVYSPEVQLEASQCRSDRD